MREAKKEMGTVQKIVTLTAALQELDNVSSERFQRHLPGSELLAFLRGECSFAEREDTLEHLSYCGKCRGRLWDMEAMTREPDFLDVVLPLAAATQDDSSFSLLSEGNRYRILFRKLLNQKGKGVVSLKVESPYQEEMEGKWLLLMDASGRQIIRSEVRNGETLANIVNSQEIDWDTLIVKQERSVGHAPDVSDDE